MTRATGADPVATATGWGTDEGSQLPPRERDFVAWKRIGLVLDQASSSWLGGF